MLLFFVDWVQHEEMMSSYTIICIIIRKFKIHYRSLSLSIVVYTFEWWWVCRLIPYYKDKWDAYSSDKRKEMEVCIFKTGEKARILMGWARGRGCAYSLRNTDSETIFRLETVRLSWYVDEAKKKEWVNKCNWTLYV